LDRSYYLTGPKGPCITIAQAGSHQIGHFPSLEFHLVKIARDLAELLN
jgi:hypothetical protein